MWIFCADHNERGHPLWNGNSKVISHQSKKIGGMLGVYDPRSLTERFYKTNRIQRARRKVRGLGHEFLA